MGTRTKEKETARDHDTFVGQVQDRAHLGSRGAAETATRATLETLAERVPAGLAVNRVAQRAGEDTPRAAHEARCVMEVVGEAAQGSLTDKIRQSLDDELASSLFAGSTGSA
ncbi:DUF2267 domain-containing protein [Streptomyces sp. ISL-96]|uniref:DUF2267 domain-containing protein n=1 Tax=Streptomyces sp. ISL-96 TaxID=2819191 RepID=UPI001BED0F19|nr:DUF2267 domain-containing protein [Streptomyces sp. ISL-96]MBT2490767.1 DUF2267 domain-containing protein [Streptomyces sp. ISL-96]